MWKGSGIKRRCVTKQDKFYYVPVLEVLQTLLSNQIVLSEVFVNYIYTSLTTMFKLLTD